MQKEIVIILVFNKAYLSKAKFTINQIRNIGKYSGDIVCLISTDLLNDINIVENLSNNIIVKYFPEIDRNEIIEKLKQKPIGDGREISKTVQWNKLFLFKNYFKFWKHCFYIDAGMHIFKPMDKILNLDCKNKLLAHSDAYPTYQWVLDCQFNHNQFPEIYYNLILNYDLSIDYFQSGIMLYDTNIIEDNTFNDLVELSKKYFISRTNEQGILNLYFNSDKKIWKQIEIKDNETYYYDYWNRNNLKAEDYIMLKYPKDEYGNKMLIQ